MGIKLFGPVILFIALSQAMYSFPANQDIIINEPSKKYAQTTSKWLKISPYGSLSQSTSSLDVAYYNKMNDSFGSQFIFVKDRSNLSIGIGLDVAYAKLYNITALYPKKPYTYLYTNFIAEIITWLTDNNMMGLTFQFGLGPNWGIQETSGIELTNFYAVGFIFRFNNNFGLNLLSKATIITYSLERPVASIGMDLGLNLYFGLQ